MQSFQHHSMTLAHGICEWLKPLRERKTNVFESVSRLPQVQHTSYIQIHVPTYVMLKLKVDDIEFRVCRLMITSTCFARKLEGSRGRRPSTGRD